jgi:hypothetical protein
MGTLDLPPTLSTTDSTPESQVIPYYRRTNTNDSTHRPLFLVSNIFHKSPSTNSWVPMNPTSSKPSVLLDLNPSNKVSSQSKYKYAIKTHKPSLAYAPKQSPSLESPSSSPSNNIINNKNNNNNKVTKKTKPTIYSQISTKSPFYEYPPFPTSPSSIQYHSPPAVLKTTHTTISPVLMDNVPTQNIPSKGDIPNVVDFLKYSSYALLGLIGFYAAYHITHVLSTITSHFAFRNASRVSATPPTLPTDNPVQSVQHDSIRILKERRRKVLESLFPLQSLQKVGIQVLFIIFLFLPPRGLLTIHFLKSILGHDY